MLHESRDIFQRLHEHAVHVVHCRALMLRGSVPAPEQAGKDVYNAVATGDLPLLRKLLSKEPPPPLTYVDEARHVLQCAYMRWWRMLLTYWG